MSWILSIAWTMNEIGIKQLYFRLGIPLMIRDFRLKRFLLDLDIMIRMDPSKRMMAGSILDGVNDMMSGTLAAIFKSKDIVN